MLKAKKKKRRTTRTILSTDLLNILQIRHRQYTLFAKKTFYNEAMKLSGLQDHLN